MCGTEAKDPKALNSLVKAMNANPDAVNRDLMTYKGVLSKLNAAKEMMKVCLLLIRTFAHILA